MLKQGLLSRLTLHCVIALLLELKENNNPDLAVLIIFSILFIQQYWYNYNHSINLHAKLCSFFVIIKTCFLDKHAITERKSQSVYLI